MATSMISEIYKLPNEKGGIKYEKITKWFFDRKNF